MKTTSESLSSLMSSQADGTNQLALLNGSPTPESGSGGPSLEALVNVMTSSGTTQTTRAKAKAKGKAKAKANVALQTAKTPAEHREAIRSLVFFRSFSWGSHL